MCSSSGSIKTRNFTAQGGVMFEQHRRRTHLKTSWKKKRNLITGIFPSILVFFFVLSEISFIFVSLNLLSASSFLSDLSILGLNPRLHQSISDNNCKSHRIHFLLTSRSVLTNHS